MQGFLIPSGSQDMDKKRQEIARMIMGQGPAQNVGQGFGQLATGISLGMGKRKSPFPTAPGGAQPSIMTGLRNFFTGGHNGGLY